MKLRLPHDLIWTEQSPNQESGVPKVQERDYGEAG